MESGQFKLPIATLTGWLFSTYGTVWIVVFGILTAIGVILSITVDWQWAIVTLMLLCLIIPMAMAFLYYFHALKAATCLNTPLHSLRLDTDGLMINLYMPKEKNDRDEKEGGKDNKGNDSDKEEKVEYEFVRNIIFPYNEFSRKSLTPSAAVYRLTRIEGTSVSRHKDKDIGVIFVPLNAFENEDLFIRFINQLDTRIEQKS